MTRYEEQERFKKFRIDKRKSFLKCKEDIKIIIFGPYNPPGDNDHLGERDRLCNIRDNLISEGYSNTCLVDDYEGMDAYDNVFEKSLDALNYANLNIFIFTCRGNNDSASRELKEAIDINILWKCRVFEEVYDTPTCTITAIGTILKKELELNRYLTILVPKENDKELYLLVAADVLNFLTHKFLINI